MVSKRTRQPLEEAARYMSAAAIASRWGLSLAATYRTIEAELPHIRISHSIRVPIEAVEAYEKRKTVAKDDSLAQPKITGGDAA